MLLFVPTALAKPKSDTGRQWNRRGIDLTGEKFAVVKGSVLENLERVICLFQKHIPKLSQWMD